MRDFSKYDFEKVKSHIDALADPNKQIRYLIEQIAEFEQAKCEPLGYLRLPDKLFKQKCEIEISKIERTHSLNKPTNNNTAQTIEVKPRLKSDAVQPVFEILKNFFEDSQQMEFRMILETGNNANEKLIFKGNANRLADTFKKLIEYGFMQGCKKKDLEKWLCSNFMFLQNNIKKEFKLQIASKYISSGRKNPGCKNPIIEIQSGEIISAELNRIKKRVKY